MISKKQQRILAFPYSSYDVLICDGAVRSGKTSIMMVAFVDWAMREFSGQRFGICGKTVDSAVKNIIVPYLSMRYARERYTLRWRRTDKLLEIGRGTAKNYFEVFGGKDESSFMLIQGRTLAGVLLDEVALMPESFFNQALARCSVDGAKMWFSCNPEGPMHWFYAGWIQQHKDRNALYLHFTMEDNPSLSEKTLQRYKSQYSGVFYERYILGKWVAAEGLVYPFFGAATHMIDAPAEEKGRYFISCDYGTINPCVFGLWRLQGTSAVMVKEYYFDSRKKKKQKTDEEYYRDLEAFAKGYQIENIIIDPSAASFKETIRRHGKYSVKDAKNAVVDGIRLTSTLLKAGLLRFDRSCTNTQAEFGAYRWDDKSSVDAVIKENDHSMDQMRYFASTVMRRELKAQGHIFARGEEG